MIFGRELMRVIFLYAVVIVLSVIVFLTAPAFRRHAGKDGIKGRYIAHRGLHTTGVPENSLAAFRAAAERGYMIENDIHITADNEIVVFHDYNLLRMCGVDKRVEDCTLNELKKYTLSGTDEKIPTLRECLYEVDGKVPLLIEFKTESFKDCKRLCAAADSLLSNYGGEYYVQSFFPPVLYWYRKNRKSVCRGQLSTPIGNKQLYKKAMGWLFYNFISRPDFISYDFRKPQNPMLRFAVLLGAVPVCWTVRNETELEKSRSAFKAYIFENFIPKE